MNLDRRDFLKSSSAFAAAAASTGLSAAPVADAGKAVVIPDEKDRLRRIASCTWPIRYIFRTQGPAIRRTGHD